MTVSAWHPTVTIGIGNGVLVWRRCGGFVGATAKLRTVLDDQQGGDVRDLKVPREANT